MLQKCIDFIKAAEGVLASCGDRGNATAAQFAAQARALLAKAGNADSFGAPPRQSVRFPIAARGRR